MALKQLAGKRKLGLGCMVLFALPFFAVGVGTTWQCVRLVRQHTAMQSWIETPAVITHAELKVKHGDDTTYKAIANYEYEFGGQKFAGDRVALGGGSDNVGKFQQNAYRELKQHLAKKKPFRCYVNPERPSEAVLYRNLRGEMLVFYMPFAALFGAAGLGLMTAVLVGARNQPVWRTENVPANAPWLARADWESGVITANNGAKVAIVALAAVGIYWWIAILPLLWKLPDVLANTHGFWKWASLAFPVIGVAIVAALVYLLTRARKFGESTLQLATTPGVVGGQLVGIVRTEKPVAATDGYHLKLSCLDWVDHGDSRSEKTIWQDERLVMEPMQSDGGGTTLPVLFAIPFDCQETALPTDKREIHWRLEVSAKVPGVDYRATFDVPAFKTSDSRPDFKLDESLVADFASAPNPEIVLRQAGLRKESLPGGGVRIVFSAARNWTAGILITAILILMCGVFYMIGPKVMPWIVQGVLGFFILVFLAIALDIWFYRSVVTADANELTSRGGLFGLGRLRSLPASEVKQFTTSQHMSSGANVWKSIEVVSRGDQKWTVGHGLNSKLAQQAVIDELREALRLG